MASTIADDAEKLPDARLGEQLRAWAVHAYTALGLVVAALITYFLVGESPERFRLAFFLMLLATAIDATDGFFARRARVKEVLPGFDGRRLDDIIDFLNYTFLPMLLLYEASILPGAMSAWLIVPLVASAYGFCQSNAKTEDGFFLGFPSYWNLVAFYLYHLAPPPWVTVVLLIVFSVLTFIPILYLYPTQPGRLNRATGLLGAGWCLILIAILWGSKPFPSHIDSSSTPLLLGVSLLYPAFYLAASLLVTGRFILRRRGEEAS